MAKVNFLKQAELFMSETTFRNLMVIHIKPKNEGTLFRE